jgi:hypothetical protein
MFLTYPLPYKFEIITNIVGLCSLYPSSIAPIKDLQVFVSSPRLFPILSVGTEEVACQTLNYRRRKSPG